MVQWYTDAYSRHLGNQSEEPAYTANIPWGMKEAYDDARQKAGWINLAKDN